MVDDAGVSQEELAALQRRLNLLHRADLILSQVEDKRLWQRRFLALMMEAAQVESGTLYLLDAERNELVFAVVQGPAGVAQALEGRRMPADRGIAGRCARQGRPIWVPAVEQSREWARDLAERSGYRPQNVLCLPLKAQERVIGVVQLFDRPPDHPYGPADLDFLSILVNDLALKLENARLLSTSREMVERLRALLEVGVELGATLDRDRLLHLILERVCQLLQTGVASIFELDEASGELVLCATTRPVPEGLGSIRVPLGEGIAGWVAREGRTEVVPDVRQDPRFYARVDEGTGFVTRAILCTPLVIQEAVAGQEGVFRRRVIGVAQALNKRDGSPFTRADIEIFEGLARQAAIAMERVRLYREVHDLFTSAIMALAEAMEAKDPYTRGHTRRVTEFSVAIAEEMGLPPDEVLKVRTAAMLHDIGKIGMPDAILQKPGRVDEAERAVIQRHPLEGERILRPLQHLREVLPGVAEHHERYDGTGYPRGLRGEEISLAGRIIAVADVFDALTSERCYRQALPAEAVLEEMRAQAGRAFDPRVLEAFWRAWEKGRLVLPKRTSAS
ncbi:MAG: HD domain-containing phosphohydrolase [Chloroflexia bacterium]